MNAATTARKKRMTGMARSMVICSMGVKMVGSVNRGILERPMMRRFTE